jgi:hypothetical protein
MKKSICVILLIFLHFQSFSQCAGTQSFTITPSAPIGGYTPGTTVTVCYTMVGWSAVGNNWLEGFDINLGSGWTNLTFINPPINCQGGSGVWVWKLTNSTPSGTVGPGWFFDSGISGPLNGNPSDDWGDFGNCTWSFCFKVKVTSTCVPLSLLIQVTAGADGDWGNWTNNTCPTIPINIYNGTVNTVLPDLPSIYHD